MQSLFRHRMDLLDKDVWQNCFSRGMIHTKTKTPPAGYSEGSQIVMFSSNGVLLRSVENSILFPQVKIDMVLSSQQYLNAKGN